MLFRAIFSAIGTVFLASTLAFFLLRVLPGDAIEGQLLQTGVSASVIQERRMQQGLDLPLIVQYGNFMLGLIRGDLGYSLIDGQPVFELIVQQFVPTAFLAFGAMIVGTSVGISLGIIMALDTNRLHVFSARFLINLSLSMPIYWIGTLAIFVFTAQLDLLPSAGASRFSHLILPVGVLGFHLSGGTARIVSSSVRQVASADYIRVARAKGLPERLVITRHILRVAFVPVLSIILLQVGFLLGGAVVTESLFVRPGIGRLLLDRTWQQDYPVVQGIVVLGAVVYSMIGILTDWAVALLDPRISRR